ncbi:MAG: MFS transporter [Roseiflexaceae bacterium]|jgi:MFS family permease|nr:MFS transporter [Chloroflexaceae bacterium]
MERQAGFLAVMRYRDFRLLWTGQLISIIGSQMRLVAVDWQVYEIATKQGIQPALALGFIGLMRLIPMTLSALFAGVAADRFDRRYVIVVTSFIALFASVVLAIAGSMANPVLWLVYAMVVVTAIANAFEMPARQALIPSLVPPDHLSQAMSAGIVSWQLGTVLGPSIAGILIASLGVVPLFWIDAATYLAVVYAAINISPPAKPTTARPPVRLADALDGLKFVFKSKVIASTMILDFFATFFGAATTLMPIFANDILGVGAQGYGFMRAAPAVGAFVAALFLTSRKIRKQGPVLLVAVAIFGLATAVFGASTWYPLTLVALAITGTADTVSMVIRGTLRQLLTPDELRGRMTAVNMVFVAGGPQLGEFVVGLTASIIGAPLAVLIGGILCIGVVAGTAAKAPELRALDTPEPLPRG